MTTNNSSSKNARQSAFNEAPEPSLPPPERIDLSTLAPDLETTIDILRLDSIDELLGGNKWFKLIPWLERARAENIDCLLSFGGPHSNHLHALAAAGERYSFRTVAFVRGGSWLEQRLSPTLQDARAMGMQLEFLGKTEYARRYDSQWQDQLAREYSALVIAEGGYSQEVLPSVARIGEHLLSAPSYEWVAVACGTGTTLAGLTCGLHANTKAIGFSVLKDHGSVQEAVASLLQNQPHHSEWCVNSRYHFGGYARITKELVDFIDRFEACTGIPLDPVYTAKMMAGLITELRGAAETSGNAPKAVLAVHTGGLQGRRAMEAKMAKLRATAQ